MGGGAAVLSDYTMVVHPWTAQRLKWFLCLKEGRYSYVWKAEYGQSWADWKGFGINENETIRAPAV